MELRTEIRSHAHSMSCHAVIGYSETASICGEIIVLSACGTAATVNMSIISLPQPATFPVSLERAPPDKRLHVDVNLASQASSHRHARYFCCIRKIYFNYFELFANCFVIACGIIHFKINFVIFDNC